MGEQQSSNMSKKVFKKARKDESYIFSLRPMHDFNMCLHSHGSQDAGAKITLHTYVCQDNLKWSLKRVGKADGHKWFYLLSANTDNAAHIHGGGAENGAACTLNAVASVADCPNIQCRFEKGAKNDDGTFYKIIFRHSGKQIQCHGGGSEDGCAVTQWDCGDYPHGNFGFYDEGDNSCSSNSDSSDWDCC